MSQVIGGVPPDVPTHTWSYIHFHLSLISSGTYVIILLSMFEWVLIITNIKGRVHLANLSTKHMLLTPSGLFSNNFPITSHSAKNRIDHVAQFIKLENTECINTNNEFVPPLLMVQIQLPSDSPTLFGTIEDGPGWAIVMYFRITQVIPSSPLP